MQPFQEEPILSEKDESLKGKYHPAGKEQILFL
jgi:hypothetical protein